MGDITSKQQRFIHEYKVDGNATAAAIRAGYSRKSARYSGHRNMQNVNIRREIDKHEQERYKRADITAETVLNASATMAFSDIAPVLHCDSRADFDALPERVRRSVAGWKRTIKVNGDEVFEIRMHPKAPAVEQLMKHLDLFAPEKHEVSSTDPQDDGGNIFIFSKGNEP